MQKHEWIEIEQFHRCKWCPIHVPAWLLLDPAAIANECMGWRNCAECGNTYNEEEHKRLAISRSRMRCIKCNNKKTAHTIQKVIDFIVVEKFIESTKEGG